MTQTNYKPMSSLPIGRRIAEIMKEKGKAFSQQAVAKRIGTSRETLRLMLNGERVILGFELEKISQVLKLPVERIKQEDTNKDERELRDLCISLQNKRRALDLAQQFVSIAVGMTERCVALNYLGQALFVVQEYDAAHQAWEGAYSYALQIKESYNETDLLFDVTTNLMISFTARKEYSNLEKIISEVSPLMNTHPERSGAITHSIAMIEFQKGNKEEARRKLYESLDYYLEVGDIKSIGMAERNVAYIEHLLGQYHTAMRYYQEAIPKLQNDDYWRLVAIKDYVKTLIRLGENSLAEDNISVCITELQEDLRHTDLLGKFYLLRTYLTNNPAHAEYVLNSGKFGETIRHLGCKVLIQYYRQIGDSEHFMKYYEMAESISPSNSDLLDEEDL